MKIIPDQGAPREGWLVSPRFDLLFVLVPVWLAGLLALCIPEGTPLPRWGWVVLVLGIDVSHVWATLYRTYLDTGELARRPILYATTPLVAFAGCVALELFWPALFWRVLAYVAVFHFVRQAVGIGVLYRARSMRPTRDLRGRIERAATYAVTLGPLWWWHTALPLPFEWFVPGDFVALPRASWLPVAALAVSVVAVHVISRISERRTAWGSDGWLLGQALVWGGILWTRSDAGFTLGNVVAHGVPYVALVWWTSRRRWTLQGEGALSPRLFGVWGAPIFVGLLLSLAFAEESLWDVFVWQERPELFGDADLSAWAGHATAILSVPQVTHYLLDGFVWRVGPNNPLLGSLLGLPPKKALRRQHA